MLPSIIAYNNGYSTVRERKKKENSVETFQDKIFPTKTCTRSGNQTRRSQDNMVDYVLPTISSVQCYPRGETEVPRLLVQLLQYGLWNERQKEEKGGDTSLVHAWGREVLREREKERKNRRKLRDEIDEVTKKGEE